MAGPEHLGMRHISVTLELRLAFGLEGSDSFAVILGTGRHAHGAGNRL